MVTMKEKEKTLSILVFPSQRMGEVLFFLRLSRDKSECDVIHSSNYPNQIESDRIHHIRFQDSLSHIISIPIMLPYPSPYRTSRSNTPIVSSGVISCSRVVVLCRCDK